MPSATTPIVAGAPVTIKGSGFTAASEIWLNAITKAGEGVKATVTAFTATSISFIAPDSISGEQNITLRQDGKEFSLGKLTFEMAKVDVAKEGLYCFYDVPEDTSTMVRHVDLSTGVVTEVVKFKEWSGYGYRRAVAIEKTLYQWGGSSSSYSKSYLYSFDLTSKTEKALKTNSKLDNVDLLVIDNKLNAASFDSETRIASLYDVNTTNGELTKIADCDMSILPLINEGQAQVYSTVYSAKENCIVMVMSYLDNGGSEYYYFVSIDLASKKITNYTFLQADDGRYRYFYSLFNKGTEIGVAKGITSDNNDNYGTEIYTIDAKTLKLGATKLGSCDGFSDWGYDVKTDILYCSSGNGAYALDLKTGAGSKVPNTETTKEEDEDGISFSGIFFLQ